MRRLGRCHGSSRCEAESGSICRPWSRADLDPDPDPDPYGMLRGRGGLRVGSKAARRDGVGGRKADNGPVNWKVSAVLRIAVHLNSGTVFAYCGLGNTPIVELPAAGRQEMSGLPRTLRLVLRVCCLLLTGSRCVTSFDPCYCELGIASVCQQQVVRCSSPVCGVWLWFWPLCGKFESCMEIKNHLSILPRNFDLQERNTSGVPRLELSTGKNLLPS